MTSSIPAGSDLRSPRLSRYEPTSSSVVALTRINTPGRGGSWRHQPYSDGTGSRTPYDRAMTDRLPRTLLHAEGIAVAVAAISLYFHLGSPWWLLVVLALVPDLSMLGYVAGPSTGALAYDLAHTYLAPVVLATIGIFADGDLAVQLALIWAAHIGVDRALGYGLKYPAGFRDTHLQRV